MEDGVRRAGIRAITGVGETQIVGSISSVDVLSSMARLRSLPFDMAEVRLDQMNPSGGFWQAAAQRLVKRGVPVILTIRSAAEGGGWQWSESARAALYELSLPYVSAVDIEIGSRIFRRVTKAARESGCVVIGSFHDFDGTPSQASLQRLASRARRVGADVVKLATMIRKPGDVDVLAGLLKVGKRGPLCVIGMGEKGRESRLRLPREGSCLAYGYVGQSAAPGQWSCEEMKAALG